jgi:hypothetical protein
MENQENGEETKLQELSFLEAKKQKICKIMMILVVVLNPLIT